MERGQGGSDVISENGPLSLEECKGPPGLGFEHPWLPRVSYYFPSTLSMFLEGQDPISFTAALAWLQLQPTPYRPEVGTMKWTA